MILSVVYYYYDHHNIYLIVWDVWKHISHLFNKEIFSLSLPRVRHNTILINLHNPFIGSGSDSILSIWFSLDYKHQINIKESWIVDAKLLPSKYHCIIEYLLQSSILLIRIRIRIWIRTKNKRSTFLLKNIPSCH